MANTAMGMSRINSRGLGAYLKLATDENRTRSQAVARIADRRLALGQHD